MTGAVAREEQHDFGHLLRHAGRAVGEWDGPFWVNDRLLNALYPALARDISLAANEGVLLLQQNQR